MNLPLVSIILPVWNPRLDWLNVAIDSAFHESRCRIELILVDDGSDQSPDAWLPDCDAQRVCLVTTPHRGVSHARNVGLSSCRGDFVRFLDADDVILPESTSMLLEVAGGDHDVVTYGSTILCDEHLKHRAAKRSHLGGLIHLQTALGRFESTIPAMLIPSKAIARVGCFDERLVVQVDWDYVLRLTEVAEFRGTQRPVYLYRRNDSSLTSCGKHSRDAIRSTVLIIKGYLNRHPELHGAREERLVRAYAQFLISKFQNPEYPPRSARFWRAAAADPVRGAFIACTRTAALFTRTAKLAVRSLIHPIAGTIHTTLK